MRPVRGRKLRVALTALLATSGAACTLLNALDELKPAAGLNPDGSTTGGDGGPAADSSSSPTEAGPNPNGPPKGVIVVGGALVPDAGTAPAAHVLTALDPTTGAELPKARRPMTVAAVAYDDARDVWYIFQSNTDSYFPNPKDGVTLHVKKIDTYTGEWSDLTSIPVPPIVAFTHVGVIADRLVYIAYRRTDADADQDMVTIDTSVSDKVGIVDTTQLTGPVPFGLMATRGTTGSQAGFVNLLRRSGCDGGGTCLDIVNYQFPDGKPVFKQARTLGQVFGSPAYGSYRRGGVDVLAWRASANDPSMPIHQLTPATLGEGTAEIPFSSNDLFLKPMAFSDCLKQALIVGTNQDLSVSAKPLETQTTKSARVVIQHSGQAVVYEPYTSTVLAPFSQGPNYELSAVTLGGTEDGPTLTIRTKSDWTPPPELRPEIVATRSPPIGDGTNGTFKCPGP